MIELLDPLTSEVEKERRMSRRILALTLIESSGGKEVYDDASYGGSVPCQCGRAVALIRKVQPWITWNRCDCGKVYFCQNRHKVKTAGMEHPFVRGGGSCSSR